MPRDGADLLPVLSSQRVLPDIQAAFTLLLGERNQFAQECAGKVRMRPVMWASSAAW